MPSDFSPLAKEASALHSDEPPAGAWRSRRSGSRRTHGMPSGGPCSGGGAGRTQADGQRDVSGSSPHRCGSSRLCKAQVSHRATPSFLWGFKKHLSAEASSTELAGLMASPAGLRLRKLGGSLRAVNHHGAPPFLFSKLRPPEDSKYFVPFVRLCESAPPLPGKTRQNFKSNLGQIHPRAIKCLGVGTVQALLALTPPNIPHTHTHSTLLPLCKYDQVKINIAEHLEGKKENKSQQGFLERRNGVLKAHFC